jgi:UPF0755 protein
MKKLFLVLQWFVATILVFALIPLLALVWVAEVVLSGSLLKRLLLVLLVILVVAFLIGYQQVNRKIGDPQKGYVVLVHPRDSAANLYARLVEAGLPVNRRLYRWYMRQTKVDRQLKPGRYRIKGGQTHYQLVLAFRDGKPELSKVTIPEGWTLQQMIPVIAHEIPTDSAELARLLADQNYFRGFGIQAPGFEGYLFPETYTFFPYQDSRSVVAEMVRMFREKIPPEMIKRAQELNMSLNQVITLASLIEAEAADGSERELISSVFHNRLQLGWKLQCDPTVIYAIGGLDRPLLRKDLEYNSPYNTYLNYGLPPGPICSPGLASIKAALYPAETNFTYFVATGSGKHVFSASLNAHNRATGKIKRNK